MDKGINQGEKIVGLEGDVHKAYDKVNHVDIYKAMRKRMPKKIAKAYMRELVSMKKVYVLDAQLKTDPVKQQRGLLQGCPEAPRIFRWVLQDVFEKLKQTWRQNPKFGIKVDKIDGHVSSRGQKQEKSRCKAAWHRPQ